MFLSNTTYLLC